MTNITSFENLCSFFDGIIKQQKQNKPMIIWFKGTPQSTNRSIQRFNVEYVNIHPSIRKENLGGVIQQTSKAAIVFHRYLGQMEVLFLQDILETKRLTNKPVFVLADYNNYAECPQWAPTWFEEVFYTPIMRVALVACSSKKQVLPNNQRIHAIGLYTSTLFKKAWAYAGRMSVDERLILSDKYGVLAPYNFVSTYNMSLKSMSPAQRARWAKPVVQSLTLKGFNTKTDEFILLTGKPYLRELKKTGAFSNIWSLYQAYGLKGIGHILHFL